MEQIRVTAPGGIERVREELATAYAKADIADRVKGILVKQSGHSQETMEDATTLCEDLDLDSLDRIEVAMLLEDEFEVEIPDKDVDNPELGTVGGLIGYIERRVA